jgi:rhodanese-related sulfurtransferase/peroxiredoxin
MSTPPSSQSRRAARAEELARAEKRRRTTKIAVIAAGVAIVVGVGIAAIGLRGTSPTADASGQAYVGTKDNFRLPGLLDSTKTVSLADHKGKPVVVNFFASWCVYCNEELPGFVQVAKTTAGSVSFVGVDTNDPGDGVAMAKRFDLAGAGFALAHDIGANPASDLWLSYGSQGLPVTAFYDADGKLVDFAGGMLSQTELEQRLQKNFGITVTAPDASTLAAPVIPLIPKGMYELLNAHGNAQNYFAVDVRSAADFTRGHITGARNLPSATAATVASQASELSKDGSYFLYDADGKNTELIAQALHDAGYKHIYYLNDGLAAWQQAGGPVTK